MMLRVLGGVNKADTVSDIARKSPRGEATRASSPRVIPVEVDDRRDGGLSRFMRSMTCAAAACGQWALTPATSHKCNSKRAAKVLTHPRRP